MEKITIKNLIEFQRKSDRSKKTFVNNLQKDKYKDDSGGGDYWVSCLSCVSNIFKTSNQNLLSEKIELLQSKIDIENDQRTKNMYQRNMDILSRFEEFDLDDIKPSSALTFQKKTDSNSIIKINDLPIHANPNHVFSFSNGGFNEIGAVWFVAKIDGYGKNELGMFADIIHRYLTMYYSNNFKVNPSYCLIVDISSGLSVNYLQIINGEVPILIDKTVNEIKKLL